MTILTYGQDNKFNEYLKAAIRGNSKSGGTMKDDFDGCYYDEYMHESATYFHIYNIDEQNYIKVYNNIKLQQPGNTSIRLTMPAGTLRRIR